MLIRTKKLVLWALIAIFALAIFTLAIYPTPATATAGSFSRMSFPGCDILLDGATVDISAGPLHVLVKQGSTVLEDRTQDVPDMSIDEYVIHFVDFAKPGKGGLSVHVDVDGVVIAALSGNYPTACINIDLSQIPTYLRDGRVSPTAGDRLAIWCNKGQQVVAVWGVDNKSEGIPLALFTVKELRAAGPQGVTKSAGGYGAVSANMDSLGNFWVAWNGGPFGANGRDSFGKAFNCQFGTTQP